MSVRLSTEGVEVLHNGEWHSVCVVSYGGWGDPDSPPKCFIDGQAVDLPLGP